MHQDTAEPHLDLKQPRNLHVHVQSDHLEAIGLMWFALYPSRSRLYAHHDTVDFSSRAAPSTRVWPTSDSLCVAT